MSVSIREQLLQAIADRVGATRALPSYSQKDLPLTVLVDGAEESTPNSYGMESVQMEAVLARIVAANTTKEDWRTEANEQMAQMIVSAFAGDDTFGGLAEGMDYAGGSVEEIQDGARGYIVTIALIVRYTFLHGNPFLQYED